jgi:hypothetical protein
MTPYLMAPHYTNLFNAQVVISGAQKDFDVKGPARTL